MANSALKEEAKSGEAEFTLQQARLYVRAGKYRFRHGKLGPGIAALYDALSYAMRWYISSPEHKERLGFAEGHRVDDERELFLSLRRTGVLKECFDFDEFETFVDEALACEIFCFDPGEVYAGVEKAMVQLSVMPFDEGALQTANPARGGTPQGKNRADARPP